MPFVPTQAAFFSAAGGVVIRRTFSAGAGQRGLESAAQFSTGCIVIGGTVCRAGSFIQVVILHTIPGSRRWNPPHSLRRAGLLSAAQFRCGVHRRAKKNGCYPAHNSQKSVFLRRVLPWVVSLRTVCPAGAGVVIDGTIQGFFSTVVIQRTFSCGRIFPSALLEGCAHFSLSLFSRPGLLYSTLFKNPTKFSLPPFSCKKTFLPLLRSAHCCVLHICVGMLHTAPL